MLSTHSIAWNRSAVISTTVYGLERVDSEFFFAPCHHCRLSDWSSSSTMTSSPPAWTNKSTGKRQKRREKAQPTHQTWVVFFGCSRFCRLFCFVFVFLFVCFFWKWVCCIVWFSLKARRSRSRRRRGGGGGGGGGGGERMAAVAEALYDDGLFV